MKHFLTGLLFLSLLNPIFGQKFPVILVDSTYKIANAKHSPFIISSKIKIPDSLNFVLYFSVYQYHELNQIKLHFKEKKLKTTLSMKPSLISVVFRSRKNRKYVLCINNKQSPHAPLLHNVPFNERIGLFSHEFAHIVDYNQRNIFGVIQRGIQYLNANSKTKFEREIDALAIQAGYGYYLYNWSSFIQLNPSISNDYKEYKLRTYMSPEEIFNQIELPKQ